MRHEQYAWSVVDYLTLPAFDAAHRRRRKQPRTATIAAERTVLDDDGVPVTYRVYVSRSGHDWWMSATAPGMRRSDTMHTGIMRKARGWIAAVRAGYVEIAKPG
jgi:hypothetical protein